MSDDALHVMIGLAIFLAIFAVIRRPWVSLAVLAVLQLLNEAMDLVENLTGSGLKGSASDTAMTLGIPILLAIALSVGKRRLS